MPLDLEFCCWIHSTRLCRWNATALQFGSQTRPRLRGNNGSAAPQAFSSVTTMWPCDHQAELWPPCRTVRSLDSVMKLRTLRHSTRRIGPENQRWSEVSSCRPPLRFQHQQWQDVVHSAHPQCLPRSSPLANLKSLGASSSARGRNVLSRNLGFEYREYVVYVDIEWLRWKIRCDMRITELRIVAKVSHIY